MPIREEFDAVPSNLRMDYSAAECDPSIFYVWADKWLPSSDFLVAKGRHGASAQPQVRTNLYISLEKRNPHLCGLSLFDTKKAFEHVRATVGMGILLTAWRETPSGIDLGFLLTYDPKWESFKGTRRPSWLYIDTSETPKTDWDWLKEDRT